MYKIMENNNFLLQKFAEFCDTNPSEKLDSAFKQFFRS